MAVCGWWEFYTLQGWYWVFANIHDQIVLKHAGNNTERKTWLLGRPGKIYQNWGNPIGRGDRSGKISYISDHENILQ